MGDWRFVVVRLFGAAGQRRMTCGRIKQAVEQMGESARLPLVKYELGRRGEYYLGLAINIPEAENRFVPEVAQAVLRSASVPVTQLIWPVDGSQVVTFLKGDLECESFTVPIAYERSDRPPEPVDWVRLIQEAGLESDGLPVDVNVPSDERFDRLLYWCSAAGDGDGARLAEVCRSLGIVDPANPTWPVLRRMVLLGHAEYEANAGLRWAVTEPTLIERCGTPDEHFLAGQRSPEFIAALSGQAMVSPTAQPDAPRRILIRTDPASGLLHLPSRPVRWIGCAAETIASALPTVDEWGARLPTWDERDFGRYQVERYLPDQDVFGPPSPFRGPTEGLHRFRLDLGGRPATTLAYYHAAACHWHCGDFYGLRFLARVRSVGCEAVWRPESRELLVQACDRWPMPYERALVLAGGLLPRRLRTASDGAFLAYPDVTEQLARSLCALLGLEWKVIDE